MPYFLQKFQGSLVLGDGKIEAKFCEECTVCITKIKLVFILGREQKPLFLVRRYP